MPFTKAASLASLEQNGLTEFTSGDDRYAICKVGDTIHAIEGICPHRGAPLAEGALHGKMLVCPWHAWEFDCTTGEYDLNSVVQLKTFPTKIEGDQIFIDIPDNSSSHA